MTYSMKKYDADISILGSDLAVGERSPHLVCPKCNGGGSGESSLLIWSDPDCLTYKCFRVNCGLFGKTGVSGYRKISTQVRKPKSKVRDLTPERLPDDVTDWLCDYFSWLTPDTLYLNGVQWEEHHERVIYPIRNLAGYDEGLLLRKYDDLILHEDNVKGIKAKTYWRELPKDYKLTGLMPPRDAARSDHIVLVEDYPSAMRINLDVPCTAISGTSLQDASLMDLIKAGIKHVVMILDADAVVKASKIVHAYRPFFHTMSFIPLKWGDKDPKDMSNAAYNNLLSQIRERLDGSANTSIVPRQSGRIRNRKAARRCQRLVTTR